jgi:hypothetical protein
VSQIGTDQTARKCQPCRVTQKPLPRFTKGGAKSKPSGSSVLHGRFTRHQPKPWFRAALNAWYVKHHDQQVRLGTHPEDAPLPKKSKAGWNAPPAILDAFYQLMASDPADLPKPDAILAAQVAGLFLAHSERHNEPATFAWYRHFL